MIELKGKYNQTEIFTDIVDEALISQVMLFLNQGFVLGSQRRLMTDVHAGAGCTIGTTMTISDKIVPNLVGVDIGYYMEVIQIKEKYIELQKLDKLIYGKHRQVSMSEPRPIDILINITLRIYIVKTR